MQKEGNLLSQNVTNGYCTQNDAPFSQYHGHIWYLLTPRKTNMTMENQPFKKMYLLSKMVVFQLVILFFGGHNCWTALFLHFFHEKYINLKMMLMFPWLVSML